MQPMRVIPMFETPVYAAQIPDHERLDESLRRAILSRRDTHPGVHLSNVGGWQSDNNMTQWSGDAGQRLVQYVEAVCHRVTARIDGVASPFGWQAEMWANVNEANASNQNHWHPGSYLSAVYYVDDGLESSQEADLGGELVFIDPRMPFLRMRTPDLRHLGVDGSADEHETWMRPRPGLLVVFPSFLGHSVRPHRASGTRISIAINMIALDPAG